MEVGNVAYLVDHAVPCVTSIVDNNMNLAVSELRCLLDQFLNILVIEHIACYSYGAAAGFVDLLCCIFCLLYKIKIAMDINTALIELFL
jgi:hypothetical protein